MAINVYGEKYKQYWNNGAHGMLMSTVHKLLEFSYLNVRSGKTNNIRILEIGGGAMPHLEWVRDRENIEEYMISDSASVLFDNKIINEFVSVHEYDKDVNLQKLSKNNYDRIIAAQVWGHVNEPEKMLLRWIDLLNKDGVLSISIPCDPGILWRTGQKVAARKFMKLYGVSFEEYDILMSREHINPAQRLMKIINYYFDIKKVVYFPLLVPSINLNLFAIITVTKKNFISKRVEN